MKYIVLSYFIGIITVRLNIPQFSIEPNMRTATGSPSHSHSNDTECNHIFSLGLKEQAHKPRTVMYNHNTRQKEEREWSGEVLELS